MLITKGAVLEAQKHFSNMQGTLSIGLAGSFSPSLVNFDLGVCLSEDMQGNFALQGTLSGGFTTGTPGGSVGPQVTITNAPNVNYLNGFSSSAGLSVAATLGGGADVVMMEDDKGNTYYGGAVSLIAGSGAEGHVNLNNTWTLAKINVFDYQSNTYSSIISKLLE